MIRTTIVNRRWRRNAAAFAGAALLLATERAGAQAMALTRERVAELVEASPATRAANAEVAVVRAAVEGAGVLSLDNPTLSGMGGVRFTDDGRRPFVGTAALSWPLDLFGQRGARKHAAVADERAARASSDAEKRQRLLAALLLHAVVLRDQREVTIAEASRALAERVLTTARRHRAAGNAPELDVALAMLQHGREAAAASAAAGDRDADLARLTAVLGVPQADAAATGALVPEGEPPRIDAILHAAEQRADVRAAVASVLAAEAKASREQAAGAPSVNLLAQYERDDGENVGTLGLSVPLPILNANNQAKATAAADVHAARARHAAVRSAAEGEVRELHARYEATKRTRETLAPTAAAVKDAVALSLRAYELGETGLSSVLLVQREALEAERALLKVEFSHASAKIELLVAAGRVPK
jgi:cobalt-zinc-cadmium efflux system outer membrane protein